MPATVEEVKELIQKAFPGSNMDDVAMKEHRIVGTIIWDKFKGMDIDERRRLVTDRVKNKFGYRGINIGLLMPLAPGDKL